MTTKFYLSSMALLIAALGFTGCKEDQLTGGTNILPDSEGTLPIEYLVLNIKTAGEATTRANDVVLGGEDNIFNSGDDEALAQGYAAEYAVVDNSDANRVFLFYGDGSYCGNASLSTDADWTDFDHDDMDGDSDLDHGNSTYDPGYSSTERFYAKVSKVNSSTEEKNPRWAVVILNGDPERLDFVNDFMIQNSGTTALKSLLQWVAGETSADEQTSPVFPGRNLGLYNYEGKNYFTMSSSIFKYDKDDDLSSGNEERLAAYGNNGIVVGAYPISDNCVSSSQEEAIENAVTIYVERVLAKVTVSFNNKVAGEGAFFVNPIESGSTKVFYQLSYDPEEENGGNITDPDYADNVSNDYAVHQGEWNINIVNWGFNAVEPNTFLIKNLKEVQTQSPTLAMESSGSSQDNNPWTITDGTFYPGWNKFPYHRSYWAVDQHYDETNQADYTFPISSGTWARTAYNYPTSALPTSFLHSSGNPYTTSTEESDWNALRNNFSLDYVSFNQINQDGTYTDGGTQLRRPKNFTLENTVGDPYAEELNNVFTNVIVVAQLIVEGIDDIDTSEGTVKTDNFMIPGVKSKYFANNRFYTEEAYKAYTLHRLLSQLERGERISAQNIKNENGEMVSAKWPVNTSAVKKYGYYDGTKIISGLSLQELVKDYFVIAPYFYAGGDGKAIIAPKDAEGGICYDGQTECTMKGDDLISLIYAYCEAADAFTNGMMYYAIPIKHNTVSATFTGGNTGGNLLVGDYGVVRNHWYRLNITGFENIGIPVRDPDQPIIPNDPVEQYLSVEIVVLPWRMMHQDAGELGGL